MILSTSGARLPLWQRRLVIGSFVLAWGSGVLLFALKNFFDSVGEFGVQRHWLEPSVRAFHGGAVLVLVFAVGSLAGGHFRAGWIAGMRRGSALAVAGVLGALAVTGWGLSYVSSDPLRAWIGWIHASAGVGLAPFFWGHVRGRAPF